MANGDGTFQLHPWVPGLDTYDPPLSEGSGTGSSNAAYALLKGEWNGDGMDDFAIFQPNDGNHLYAVNTGARIAVPPSYSNARFARYGDSGYHKDYFGSG